MSEDEAQGEDCPCGTDQCREAYRELRSAREPIVPDLEGVTPEEGGSMLRQAEFRFRDIIREEVAQEVARQLREPLCGEHAMCCEVARHRKITREQEAEAS